MVVAQITPNTAQKLKTLCRELPAHKPVMPMVKGMNFCQASIDCPFAKPPWYIDSGDIPVKVVPAHSINPRQAFGCSTFKSSLILC